MMRKRFDPLLAAVLALLLLLVAFSGCKESQDIVEDYAEGVMVRAPNSARRVRVETDLRQIRAAVEYFHGMNGRYPQDLQEVARSGIMARIPREALGGRWEYDPTTGRVSSSSIPEL